MHNGHLVGDEVLRDIGRTLAECDAYRIGGETFAAFIRTEADAEVIRAKVEREVNPIQLAECGDKHCTGPQPPPRVSIGVTDWRGESIEALLDRATEAMYDAKANGRNRVALR